MIHPLVYSWLLMMTTMEAYALRSPIHSPLVAGLMNLGRDAIVSTVALVKCTILSGITAYHFQHLTPILPFRIMLYVPSQHALAIPLP